MNIYSVRNVTIVVGDGRRFREKVEKIVNVMIKDYVEELNKIYERIREHEKEEFYASMDKLSYKKWLVKRKELYNRLSEIRKTIVKIMHEYGIIEYFDSTISIDLRYPPWNHYL